MKGGGLWSIIQTEGTFTADEPVSEQRTSVEGQETQPAPPGKIPELKRDAEERFRLLGRIGAGGMGAVYRVRDRNLLREAAMKVLNPALASKEKYVQRFLGEVQIQAQLDHPNIVPVHELALDQDGTSYFTMRFVRGRTLSSWIKDSTAAGTLTEAMHEMLSAFLKVCDALAFAHSRGVIHCDVKPDNVILEDFGAVYLMDWGLARLVGRPDAVTAPVAVSPEAWSAVSSGGVIGTPAFMSPEQALGSVEQLDQRSDVFGLGAVLYMVLTGRPPYAGTTMDEVVGKARARDVSLPPLAPGGLPLPPGICGVVARAMAPDPAKRYQSALELKRDVERFLRGGLAFPTRKIPAGQRIVVEGEQGDTAYVVTQGTCVAYKTVQGARRVLREMGPGAVFGETAVFSPGPRTATVEAVTDMVVRVVTRQSLEEGLGLDSIFGAFVVALAERFRELDARVGAQHDE